MSEYIAHYGVKGMKWGKKKNGDIEVTNIYTHPGVIKRPDTSISVSAGIGASIPSTDGLKASDLTKLKVAYKIINNKIKTKEKRLFSLKNNSGSFLENSSNKTKIALLEKDLKELRYKKEIIAGKYKTLSKKVTNSVKYAARKQREKMKHKRGDSYV